MRLYKGDYAQMTTYSEDPVGVAKAFERQGATHIHVVDLEGAEKGTPVHLPIVERIVKETNLFLEIGGGIRSMERVEGYLSRGAHRVILGTAAVTDEAFLREAVAAYGDKIAVGADIVEGKIAIRGWKEKSGYEAEAFFQKMQDLGVRTVICTDVSKDGAMRGTNLALYQALKKKFKVDIIASGGVSSLADVKALAQMEIYGAIIGKAYYIGAIDLKEAIEVAK